MVLVPLLAEADPKPDVVGIVIWCTILALLVAVAVYIVGRFRGSAEEEQPQGMELLTKFREMHSQGGLSDEEFRTIKTQLAASHLSELKDTGEKG